MSLKRSSGNTPGFGSAPPEDVPSTLDDLSNVSSVAATDGQVIALDTGAYEELSRTAWSAAASTNESGKTADLAIDASGATYWQSTYTADDWITVDMGSATTVTKIEALISHGESNGTITLRSSPDNSDWTARGSVQDWNAAQVTRTFEFAPVSARYWQLVQGGYGSRCQVYDIGAFDTVSEWLPVDAPHITQETIVSGAGAATITTAGHRIYAPVARTIAKVRIMEGAGGSVTADVHKGGTTIFTTQGNRPAVATSGYVSARMTPDVTAWAADSYLEVMLDAVTGAEDVTVIIEWSDD